MDLQDALVLAGSALTVVGIFVAAGVGAALILAGVELIGLALFMEDRNPCNS